METLVRTLGRPTEPKKKDENARIYPVCDTLLKGAEQPTNMAPDLGSETCDRRGAMQALKSAGARVEFLTY